METPEANLLSHQPGELLYYLFSELLSKDSFLLLPRIVPSSIFSYTMAKLLIFSVPLHKPLAYASRKQHCKYLFNFDF